MFKRGVIYNRDKKRRLMTFEGLQFGNITPTDIDAFIDFGGKVYVVIEAKGVGVPVPTGQRIALERLLHKLGEPPSKAIVVIADTPDGAMEDDVDLGQCCAREVWHLKDCKLMRSQIDSDTVRDVIDKFKFWAESQTRFLRG